MLGARTIVRSIAISPGSADLDHGAKEQFSAIGDSKGVTWTLNPAEGVGTIDQTGLYVAPRSNGSVQVIATSKTNSRFAAAVTVTIRKKDIRPTPSQASRR